MPKATYYIKGMHCPSCELLIEKELSAMEGIAGADVSLRNSSVTFEFEKDKPSTKELDEKFEKYGYTFSEIPAAYDKQNFLGIFATALLFIGAFLLLGKLGLSTLVNINYQSSLGAFFVFGIIAGVSSCAALVGGLVLSFSQNWMENYGSENLGEKIRPHLLFNLGRLISFALLGTLLGFLGEKFRISPAFTSVLILLISLIMLVLALQMLGVKAFQNFKLALPKQFSRFVLKEPSETTPLLIGFLTFLLPCGFTVIAEGAAVLSGDPLRGSLIMSAFVLGTTLPLLAIGLGSTKFLSTPRSAKKFSKVAGILIIFFVLYNLNTQFNVSGYLSPNIDEKSASSQTQNNNASDNIQTIKAVYTDSNDIQPASFQVKKGQPVRFEVEAKDNASGCMSTIMIPGLWDKPLSLRAGKTVVMEFTPEKTGTYQITCAMGVPRGNLQVTD